MSSAPATYLVEPAGFSLAGRWPTMSLVAPTRHPLLRSIAVPSALCANGPGLPGERQTLPPPACRMTRLWRQQHRRPQLHSQPLGGTGQCLISHSQISCSSSRSGQGGTGGASQRGTRGKPQPQSLAMLAAMIPQDWQKPQT